MKWPRCNLQFSTQPPGAHGISGRKWHRCSRNWGHWLIPGYWGHHELAFDTKIHEQIEKYSNGTNE